MKCIAHRGWSSFAPENTMAAFYKALDHDWIYGIELDVHLSKDGIPVVIHDHTLCRTTNGTGEVREYTYAELLQLDAGSWYRESFSDERIPSLEQALQAMKDSGKKVTIELKQVGSRYPGLEEKVVEVVERLKMVEQVIFASFDHVSVERIFKLAPQANRGLIIGQLPNLILEQLDYVKARYLMLEHHFAEPNLLEELKRHGIHVGVWTIDDELMINRKRTSFEDVYITTNNPRILKDHILKTSTV
ncbi:glycerophosphodiester phosphodiesterase [Alkalicoccobacillus plakortidis]|uniref:Glycerophosphodiester phosphodiesterase n=1 Tax=Alkalicoccobacillus plakortidis TaxID=444060 RepID=A0ABT0XLS1_9BACI|nr:glycerophosphodiester phosphodiesterase family protein [Alkalicoccobacillus plakortidis]MCM2676152.1 glycerophosphodiester phosphodiesterase [Alkalicoccobacillus plakortidis]